MLTCISGYRHSDSSGLVSRILSDILPYNHPKRLIPTDRYSPKPHWPYIVYVTMQGSLAHLGWSWRVGGGNQIVIKDVSSPANLQPRLYKSLSADEKMMIYEVQVGRSWGIKSELWAIIANRTNGRLCGSR